MLVRGRAPVYVCVCVCVCVSVWVRESVCLSKRLSPIYSVGLAFYPLSLVSILHSFTVACLFYFVSFSNILLQFAFCFEFNDWLPTPFLFVFLIFLSYLFSMFTLFHWLSLSLLAFFSATIFDRCFSVEFFHHFFPFCLSSYLAPFYYTSSRFPFSLSLHLWHKECQFRPSFHRRRHFCLIFHELNWVTRTDPPPTFLFILPLLFQFPPKVSIQIILLFVAVTMKYP